MARFQSTLELWIKRAMASYANAPATDVHDQGTYTTGWEPYLQANNDKAILTFLKQLRDQISDHFIATGQWRHGYWTMQEAHHGTEHYELFLGMLWRLDERDPITIAQITDVAEHLGNWSPTVEPWFDWTTGLYRSFLFGADGVAQVEGSELNVPDHLRCINIALLAYRATGEGHYLELATIYGRRWADAILADEKLPIALLPNRIVYQFDPAEESIYRKHVGQSSLLQSPLDRAESFLASDAINTFLALWQATNELTFRAAAETLLEHLAPALADPDGGSVADAIRHYRLWTNDTRYDTALCAAVAPWQEHVAETIAFDLSTRARERPSGIGKRADMLIWLENTAPRRLNPITLGVAAEITGDETLATYALDLACAYLQLAQGALPDGRDHGCAARSVSAVARGHGRENHAGMTTALFGPLYRAFNNR